MEGDINNNNSFSVLAVGDLYKINGGEETTTTITITISNTESSFDSATLLGTVSVNSNGNTDMQFQGKIAHTETSKTTVDGFVTDSSSFTIFVGGGVNVNNNSQITPTVTMGVSYSSDSPGK